MTDAPVPAASFRKSTVREYFESIVIAVILAFFIRISIEIHNILFMGQIASIFRLHDTDAGFLGARWNGRNQTRK